MFTIAKVFNNNPDLVNFENEWYSVKNNISGLFVFIGTKAECEEYAKNNDWVNG